MDWHTLRDAHHGSRCRVRDELTFYFRNDKVTAARRRYSFPLSAALVTPAAN